MHFSSEVEMTNKRIDYCFETDNRFQLVEYGTNCQVNVSETN